MNHALMKLGKRAPRIDSRTLKLARYFTPELPLAPPAVDWSAKVTNLGMMKNDEEGDCAEASPGHMEQCWTAANGSQVIISDADIIGAYSAITGYVPGDPSTDNGSVMLDVMNYWRKTGIGGRKIAAFAALDLSNEEHFRQAIWLFGGVNIGAALSISDQNQEVWSIAISGDLGDPTPGSWGGHSYPIVGYDMATGRYKCITWGAPKYLTFDWMRAKVDEAFVALSSDWAAPGVLAPSGFDLVALQADLRAVTG